MLSSNPNYILTLTTNTNPVITVQANLPEEISLSAVALWESPHVPNSALGLAESFLGSNKLATLFASAAINAFNMNAISQALSWQIWQGSSPLEFSFNMLFDAECDALNDVVVPMMNLQQLVLPTRAAAQGLTSDILLPPGPSAASPTKNMTTLYLGSFAVISPVVLTAVNNTFDTRLSSDGYPISGRSEVTVRTLVVPAREDIMQWFFLDSNGNPITGTTSNSCSSSNPTASPSNSLFSPNATDST